MTAEGDRLSALIEATFAPGPPQGLGVAVSGGGDSVALLRLLAAWRGRGGPDLAVVTVDHGLRPEAAAEASFVEALCRDLGVAHERLRWSGWDGKGNLSDQARRARYRLIADWARGRGLRDVALGHTRDDQAETVLMRLGRGSGVDGLSGMADRRLVQGVLFRRPLLAVGRAELRAYLTALGQRWVDDPTNDDPGYGRVAARKALALLEPLGITVEGLNATAARLSMAQAALRSAAHDLARASIRLEGGDVIMDRALFDAAPFETRARLFAHALCWVSSAEYRPRFSSLSTALEQAAQGARVTLQGCLILPRKATYRVTREQAALPETAPVSGLWDGRWRLTGPSDAAISVRPLGRAGLEQLPFPRDPAWPEASFLVQPTLWRDTTLVAAPLTGWSNGWTAELARDTEDFFTSLIAH